MYLLETVQHFYIFTMFAEDFTPFKNPFGRVKNDTGGLQFW